MIYCVCRDMSEDWTERYRPNALKDILGNPKAVSDLKGWATSWNDGVPDRRAVVLIGKPGIGKTSAAVALANDMKWDLVEMNASDQRTGDAIRSVALKGASFNTFSDSGSYLDTKDGGRKLIVLDEADNLFGREDRGALPAISELIRNTRQPVILIVNDFNELSRKSAAVKSDTLQITFMRPRIPEIIKALEAIAKKENVTADGEALRKIAENSNGDMRAAVRNLESLALGRTSVTGGDASELSDRILRKDIYELVNSVFNGKDAMATRRMMMDVDETPDTIMLWIDENLPHQFKDKGDLTRGYEKLARADVFLGRVSRRQYYRFWAYAGDMMSSGVNISRRTKSESFERIRFPSYLSKMSRSKGIRAVKKSVCLKLSAAMHTSTARMANDVLPSLKAMIKNDNELAGTLVRTLELEPEETAFLLDEKIDSKMVKELTSSPAKEAATPHAKGPAAKAKKEDTEDIQESKKEKKAESKDTPKMQKSLFQF